MAPGWYPDPWHPGGLRWFDGVRWTEHAGPGGAAFGPVDHYDAQKGRSTSQWAGWAFLGRGIIQGLQLLIVPLVFAHFFDDVSSAMENPDSANSFGSSYGLGFTLVGQLGGLVIWAAVAALCVWTYRATKNANLLGLRTQFSPGLAVGGWLIPLANLVMPYLAVRDLFPEGHSGRRDAGIWWGTEIAASILGIAAFAVVLIAGGGAGLAVGIVAAACAVTAGVLGFRLTRSVLRVHAELARATGIA